MSCSRSRSRSLCFLLLCVVVISSNAQPVPIVIVEKAKEKGAVCLDGSPPAYFFQNGSGQGINNWLIIVEGGGWCETVESCASRLGTERGSSVFMNKTTGYGGFLGGVQSLNPDFYNWNRVKVRYCDGASFTGDVEEPLKVNQTAQLFFRGQRIWDAIMAELMDRGMKNASKAILSGCSAGGLAAILHCDQFRALLPKEAIVKCISDAGYFIRGSDLTKNHTIDDVYGKVVALHGSVKTLPKSCKQAKPELCFFPQFVAETMETPLFLINSPYDSWQIGHILAPNTLQVAKTKEWNDCRLDIAKCSPDQLKIVQAFRDEFVKAVETGAGKNPKNGYFINSYHAHCQTSDAENWIGPKALKLKNTEVWKAVGDWFFDRAPTPFREIDPPYPSNPTCPSLNKSTSA
ncbi:pectin acetylesterase 7-like [Euphorbia lathyris]|uniref:pectin acetylesterase 7-like n=1 Tax=Euphorbia lathyris TaxID=212925 RepID=UPI00331400D4